MTGSAKVKGDRAEREASALLADHLGYSVRRKLGAGRADDEGDLEGLPDTVVQVANWQDLARALRVKPVEAEQQRVNAGVNYAVTMLRLRGGDWRLVMTPEQFAALWREAEASPPVAAEGDVAGVNNLVPVGDEKGEA